MLRPLALMDPIGKTVMRLVALKVREQAWDSLVCWPQYAYRPHRSTFDPVARVAHHCRAARAIRASQGDGACGVRSVKSCGALQIFLDVDKAFDSAPRQAIFQGLQECGVDGGAHFSLGGVALRHRLPG